MAKVMEVKDAEGKHHGWMIHCPACECGHQFDDRWTFNGDVENPTFRASMLVHGDDYRHRCHSYVTDGKIEFLSDCGHEMAGQTVELPDWKKDLFDKDPIPCEKCSIAEGCKRHENPAVIGCLKGKLIE
jgi:hypothetical protein